MVRSSVALVALLALGGLGVLFVARPGEETRVAAELVGAETVQLVPGRDAVRDMELASVADPQEIRPALERSVAVAAAREADVPAPPVARAEPEEPEPPAHIPLVRVIVLDDAHRTAAGVPVGLYGEARCRRAETRVVSDANGEAWIQLDEERLAELRLDAPRAWIAVDAPLSGRERVEIDLREPPPESVRLQVGAFGSIRVRFDRPVLAEEELYAELESVEEDEGWPYGSRDACILLPIEGSELLVPCVQVGRSIYFVAWSEDRRIDRKYASLDAPSRPGETAEHEVVLDSVQPHYRLRLVDPSGLPLGDAPVGVKWTWSAWETAHRTDAEGVLLLDGRPEGYGEVGLRVRTRDRAMEGTRSVSSGSGGEIVELGDLVLAPPPAIVGGRVLSSRGEAIPGAEVELHAADGSRLDSTRADDEGRFEIRGFRTEDSLFLEADAYGYVPSEKVAFQRRATDVEIRLEDRGGIHGSIEYDAELGPIRFDVELVDVVASDGRSVGTWSRFEVPSEGRFQFTFEKLPAGRATVRISLPHDPEPLIVCEGVEVPAGKIRNDPRLDGVDLTGRLHRHVVDVRDARGVAVPDPWIVLREHGGGGAWAEGYADDGVAVLVSRHATIDLRAGAAGLRTAGIEGASGSVQIVLGEALPVVLELDPAIELQGDEELIVDLRPAWMPGGDDLIADSPSVWFCEARSGRIAAPEPGEYLVFFWHSGSDEPFPGAHPTLRIADDPREQTFTVAPDPEALRLARARWAEDP